jgi:probable rRNA maturation factor
VPVSFHKESISFRLANARALKAWVTAVVEAKGKKLGNVAYVFCSDEYLLQINQEHLQHDYYTDIITFDYTEGDIVSGDLFISVDRVKENALKEAVDFDIELHRVMIHGILHLLGLKDKKKDDQEAMRRAENQSLTLFESFIVPRGT